MVGRQIGAGSRTVWLTAADGHPAGRAGRGMLELGLEGDRRAATTDATVSPAAVERGITLGCARTERQSEGPADPRGVPGLHGVEAPGRGATSGRRGDESQQGPRQRRGLRREGRGRAATRSFLTASLARSIDRHQRRLARQPRRRGMRDPEGRGRRSCASIRRRSSANTDDNAADQGHRRPRSTGALPSRPSIAGLLHQSDPAITAAQLGCINSKMTTKTWAAMAAAATRRSRPTCSAPPSACGLG